MSDNKINTPIIINVFSRLDCTHPEALRIRDMHVSPAEELRLYRERDFASDNSSKLLHFLAEYDDGFYRPDKCNTYEPLREPFDPDDLREPIRWLSLPSGSVLFRKSKPWRIRGAVENQRLMNIWDNSGRLVYPDARDPVFLTHWNITLQPNVFRFKSLESVRDFFKDLCLVSEADFGSLSSEEEYRSRNYLCEETEDGSIEQFVGLDLEHCLPGLYFANFFGKLYVDLFGSDAFRELKDVTKERLRNGGWYLQVSDDLQYFESTSGRIKLDTIMGALGEDAFFDISNLQKICSVPREIETTRRFDKPHWR